jgi:hypothetical protein
LRRTLVSVVEGAAVTDGGPVGVPVVVRVVLPDRPGALGLVASRIGALGGDIVGIDVLERGERLAIDEFSVVLGAADLAPLLVREIEEVDGASVEECRVVEAFADPRLDALESAEQLAAAPSADALRGQLVRGVVAAFTAEWSALLPAHADDPTFAPVTAGAAPDAPMLHALAAGTAASPLVAEGVAGPDDLMVAQLPAFGAVLLVGRAGHRFRRRERKQLLALARVADHMGARLTTDA